MNKIKSSDIKAMLDSKGVTQAQIARNMGVSRSAVNLVIEGKSRSNRIQIAIAVALGQNVETLF